MKHQDTQFESGLETLPRAFYERNPHELARVLLGKLLVRRGASGLRVARIVELEVYGGVEDPSSHSNSDVPTERTEAMFGEPGSAYIYRSYGIHRCLNVVAPRTTRASALLVRAAEPLVGIAQMAESRGRELSRPPTLAELSHLMSGPGKLCQALDIDMSFNGDFLDARSLGIAYAEALTSDRIGVTKRIGLNPKTCGDSVEWEWRYVVKDSAHLSRPYRQ